MTSLVRVSEGRFGAGEIVALGEQASQAERRIDVASLVRPAVGGLGSVQVARLGEQAAELSAPAASPRSSARW